METKTRITLEEYFERFDPDNPTELVDGEMVPLDGGGVKVTQQGAFTLGEVVYFLKAHVRAHGGGFVLVDNRFVLGLRDDPEAVRIPDIAFVRSDRAEFDAPAGRGAPDLAIEVISPSDPMVDVIQKVREYLSAGARLVWVIVAETRTVMVYHSDGGGTILNETGVLDGEPVLSGLAIPIRELFLPE